jgi:hypothetical protein
VGFLMDKEVAMLGTVKVMKSARCMSSKQSRPRRQRRALHQQLGPPVILFAARIPGKKAP